MSKDRIQLIISQSSRRTAHELDDSLERSELRKTPVREATEMETLIENVPIPSIRARRAKLKRNLAERIYNTQQEVTSLPGNKKGKSFPKKRRLLSRIESLAQKMQPLKIYLRELASVRKDDIFDHPLREEEEEFNNQANLMKDLYERAKLKKLKPGETKVLDNLGDHLKHRILMHKRDENS